MNKSIIATAITLSVLCSTNAAASPFVMSGISVTSMFFEANGTNYATTGTLYDDGSGALASVDPFFSFPWIATQETLFMDNTGTWSGTSLSGVYNANAFISAMTTNQVAVGLFFDWNGSNDIAILEIFDCDVALVCTGTGVSIFNGPFAGLTVVFNPATSVVPVPAAAWLMGSGLLGIVGLARRRA